MALFEKFLAGNPTGAESGPKGAESGKQRSEGDQRPDSAQRSVTEGQVEVPQAPKTQGKARNLRGGRPRLPDDQVKYIRRKGVRHDEHGRVIKHLRKRKNDGPRHYKVRRKKARELVKRTRIETNYRYVRQYNATIWRKYLQNRSWNRSIARKKGLDPDAHYQITFADWVRVWDETEAVWRDGEFHRPIELQDNPVRRRGECTWFARVDDTGAFTLDNVCIRYRYKVLQRKT